MKTRKLLLAEILKHKDTLAATLVFSGPVLMVLLMGIQTHISGAAFSQDMTPARFFIQNNLTLWSFLMLPFFISLITTLSGYIEHKNKSWNILLIQGNNRLKIFGVKLLVVALLLLVSYLIWWLFLHVGALILSSILPEFGSWTIQDSVYAAHKMLLMFLVSYPMLCIHFWIAQKTSNIVLAFGVGIVVTTTNFLMVNSPFNWLFPWSFPLLVAQPGRFGQLELLFFTVPAYSFLLTFTSLFNLSDQEY